MDQPTPIASPAFVVWRVVNGVKKPRVVIGLRPLNSITVPDAYPLPDQSDIMAATRGKKYYSIFDARGFFHQLPIYAAHRNWMVVISERGLEVSNVVLIGFKNAPSFGQSFMDRLFFRHRDFIRVYIDDIVVFSDTFEEHIEHLCTLFETLTKHRLRISAEKSFIGYPAVKLLGYIVDGNGTQKTEDRLQAFAKLRMAENLADLKIYIGMVGRVKQSIPWYDIRIKPLQERKVALLQATQKEETLAVGMAKPARRRRAQQLQFNPTERELAAFDDLQSFLSNQFFLYHQIPTGTSSLRSMHVKRGSASMSSNSTYHGTEPASQAETSSTRTYDRSSSYLG